MTKTWKKALEDKCKYENINDNGANLDVEQLDFQELMHISKVVGSTDSAKSRNKTDFMRKFFSINQVSSMPMEQKISF